MYELNLSDISFPSVSFSAVQLTSSNICDEVIFDFLPIGFAPNGYPFLASFFGKKDDFDKISDDLRGGGQFEQANILSLLVCRARRGDTMLRIEEAFLRWPCVFIGRLLHCRTFCFFDLNIGAVFHGEKIGFYAESAIVEQAIVECEDGLLCVIRPIFYDLQVRYGEFSSLKAIGNISSPFPGLFSLSDGALRFNLFQNGWQEEYIPSESLESLCDESADASKMDFSGVIRDLLWSLNI